MPIQKDRFFVVRQNQALFKEPIYENQLIFKQVNINIWILTENIQWIISKHYFYGQSTLSLITDWHSHYSFQLQHKNVKYKNTLVKGKRAMAFVYSCSDSVQLFAIKCGRNMVISIPQFLDQPLSFIDIYSTCPTLQNSIFLYLICNINCS